MEHRRLNFTIPLYFDNSVSYLELVANLHSHWHEVQLKWEDIETKWLEVEPMVSQLEALRDEILASEAQHVADMKTRADTFEAEIRAQQEQHEQKVDASVAAMNNKVTTLETDVANIKSGTIIVKNANHADKADKLTTARNIQLTGDVSGSAAFDGSQDIQINCTVAGGTGGGASSEELQALTGRVNTLEGTVNTINGTEIPGIKSRLSTLENVHEIGSTVPQTLAAGHIYFQIPAE